MQLKTIKMHHTVASLEEGEKNINTVKETGVFMKSKRWQCFVLWGTAPKTAKTLSTVKSVIDRQQAKQILVLTCNIWWWRSCFPNITTL